MLSVKTHPTTDTVRLAVAVSVVIFWGAKFHYSESKDVFGTLHTGPK
jgi:hypothetical protein